MCPPSSASNRARPGPVLDLESAPDPSVAITKENEALPGSWRHLLGPGHRGPMTVLAGGVALYATTVYVSTGLLPTAVAEILLANAFGTALTGVAVNLGAPDGLRSAHHLFAGFAGFAVLAVVGVPAALRARRGVAPAGEHADVLG